MRLKLTHYPLTATLESAIRQITVREAVCAQHCGSYSSAGKNPLWYCVETLPKAEFQALSGLTNQRFKVYLPLEVYRRDKKAPIIRPVFPRYLFVNFDRHSDQWRPIVSTKGVRRLFSSSPEMPIPIPGEVIERFQAQGRPGDGVLDDGAALDPNWTGDGDKDAMFRVKDGPWAQFHGICTMSTRNRVKLLLSIFGRDNAVEFPRKLVERV